MSDDIRLLASDECPAPDSAAGFGRLMKAPPASPRGRLGLPGDLARSIPEHLAQRYKLVPISLTGTRLLLGMADPLNVIAIDDIRMITGFEIDTVQVPEDVVRRVISCGRCDTLVEHFVAIGREDLFDLMVPLDDPHVPLEKRFAPGAPFPLASLVVDARVTGPLASVKVTQVFHNPYQDFLEAVYIFPLSAEASVHAFRMEVGDRLFEADIHERREANCTYEAAKKAGHRTAIIGQDRDNVFTVRVGNLPPGESVRIEFEYAEHLNIDAARTTFRFPLVVAPRYIPGIPLDGPSKGHGTSPDTDVVPDASRITPPLLFPGLREPSALAITVHVETGGRIPALLACSQHAISSVGEGNGVTVSLTRERDLFDRDFVLQIRLADAAPAASLLIDPSHFLLSLWPPVEAPTGVPRDVIFLVDRSGSMRGEKMDSARRAVASFLGSLSASDRFALLAFDDRIETWGGLGLHPSARSQEAVAWLERVDARGGTEMAEPLRQVLTMHPPPGRLQCVVLVTDGQVGNEAQMYEMVVQGESPARIFTLGIDSAVNDAFLRELARLGRGTCELVTTGEALALALDRLSREIAGPIVTDLEIEDRGIGIEADSHAPLSDLYAKRPVHVLGRHHGDGGALVRGKQREGAWQVDVTPTPSLNPALPILWARARVRTLEDQLRLQPDRHKAVKAEIVALALRYRLLTRFTSFVLVDHSEVVNPGGEVRVAVQPVPLPSDWDGSVFEGYCADLGEVQDVPSDLDDFEVEACVASEELEHDALAVLSEEAPIVRVVNLILFQALHDGATHVHVESHLKCMTVRYRIDGVLHEVMNPPKHISAGVAERVRRMAGMKRDQSRGRIHLRRDGVEWDIEVSACPTRHGDRFVLWLRRVDEPALRLEALGLADVDALQTMLARGGCLLVAGTARADGVRACLADLASEPGRNVLEVGGFPLRDVQSVTLPAREALDAVCGQDLDALAVAQVSSRAIARRVVRAARGGCTVVAGIDAEDAATALWRMARWSDTSVVRGVLVGCQFRAVCPSCGGAAGDASLAEASGLDLVSLHEGAGCESCLVSGFRGTVMAFSLVEVGDDLRGATLAQIRATVKDGGLRERAIARVRQGKTTLDEVARVLGPP